MKKSQGSCPQCDTEPALASRRDFILRCGNGFGLVALTYLLSKDSASAEALELSQFKNPFAPKPPHFPARAKNVIYLFMSGGPSHMDTFDPKPLLTRLDGQPVPASFKKVELRFTTQQEALLASRRTFQKYGQCGLEVADTFANVGRFADDLAVIRSCHHDALNHPPAENLLNTGSVLMGRPSMGSWVVYGLGSESENLPAFVVMLPETTTLGPGAYGSGFLPAAYQGTVMRSKGRPLLNLTPPPYINRSEQRSMLDLLSWYNERHLETRQDDTNLAARIAAYELAFRMQSSVPELVDLSKESESTKALYGIDNPLTLEFGLKCLLARRMVERGVRFIQLYSGDRRKNWDAHDQCDKKTVELARSVDKPIAGLLQDLKQRGLLESTLVIWGGEFGRTPSTDPRASSGREHNPHGFTMWIAGGGIKGGKVVGATDDIGLRAEQDPVHVHDIHATILALLGLDHRKLIVRFQGRDQRLTDIGGDKNLAPHLTSG